MTKNNPKTKKQTKPLPYYLIPGEETIIVSNHMACTPWFLHSVADCTSEEVLSWSSGWGSDPHTPGGDQNCAAAEGSGAADSALLHRATCSTSYKSCPGTEPTCGKWEQPRDFLQDCAAASNQSAKADRAHCSSCNWEHSPAFSSITIQPRATFTLTQMYWV